MLYPSGWFRRGVADPLPLEQRTLYKHLYFQKFLCPAAQHELPGWQEEKPGEWHPIIYDKSESSLKTSDNSSSATSLTHLKYVVTCT